MNRRLFSQLLAFGTGVLTAEAAESADQQSGDPSNNDNSGRPNAARRGTPAGALPVTVQDFVAAAQEKLPPPTFDYLTTGSEDEVTLRDNVEAFRRIRVIPPLLHGVKVTDLSTTVLGEKVDLPVLLAPVAALRMFHPDGGRASARAAAKAGTVCAVSTSVCNSLEEVASAAAGPKWFQLYVPKKRDIARGLVQRAEAAGYKALVVTVDLGERKDADLRNHFSMPKEMLLKHLRDVGHTGLDDDIAYDELVRFNADAWELSLNPDFFRWLRGVTRLPILIKGVLTPDAASQAIDLGVNGIIVSNHGGRRLDGMPASIDMLAQVADTAAGRVEVFMDGGIRRGGDVMKAIALGARAVLIGRPQAWALAAGGEAGVARVLHILRDELENAMISCGFASIDAIDHSVFAPGTLPA